MLFVCVCVCVCVHVRVRVRVRVCLRARRRDDPPRLSRALLWHADMLHTFTVGLGHMPGAVEASQMSG